MKNLLKNKFINIKYKYFFLLTKGLIGRGFSIKYKYFSTLTKGGVEGGFNNQSGQGLLELIVAIGVITVGLFSVWNFFLSNFNGEKEANARVLAINLAREGIEAVKNIRDSNWLHIENNSPCSYDGRSIDPCKWDSGLDGDGVGIVKNLLSDQVSIDYDGVDSLDDDKTILYINSDNGFYSEDNTGQRTLYRRVIELQDICCTDNNPQDSECDDSNFSVSPTSCPGGQLKVGLEAKSTVRWTIDGAVRTVEVKDQLYDWK